MLTLYDLSTRQYIDTELKRFYKIGFGSLIALPLIKYNITNYGLLEEEINSQNPEFQNPVLKEELKRAKKHLAKLNRLKKEYPSFAFPKYGESGFSKEVLDKTDKKVSCKELPLISIMSTQRSTPQRIENFSIHEAKILLALSSFEGKNAFTNACKSMGDKKTEKIAKSIEFYEDQILRVAASIPNLEENDENLFIKDKDLKEEAIQDRILDIILFLIANGNEYIWGPMQEHQKEKLYDICQSAKNSQDMRIKRNFINIIRNYTTIGELSAPTHEMHESLTRFIVK